LLEWVIAEARAAGYAELIGDTLPVMRQALALYRQMRFDVEEPREPGGIISLRRSLLSGEGA